MSDRRLLVATRSVHKLGELRALLALERSSLVSLDDVGIPDEASEEGVTFEENAVAKARFYAERSRLPTLADDSGLEVDALGGRPGVRTRRYAGPNATDDDNNDKLLRELDGVPPDARTARYRCALAFVEPLSSERSEPVTEVTDEEEAAPIVCLGTFEGRIALSPRGDGGFGYDPIFEPLTESPGGRTVGEMSAAEKNAVSHRAAAARDMSGYLRKRGY